jgi:hypothetical protein
LSESVSWFSFVSTKGNYTIVRLIARTAILPVTFIARYYHKDMTFQGGYTKYFAEVEMRHKDIIETSEQTSTMSDFQVREDAIIARNILSKIERKRPLERLIPDQFL